MTAAVPVLSVIMLCGCEGLTVRDTPSLLVPRFQRSEVFGFVAGFGTTFAAVPDLVRMLKRRSSRGMNPTMGGSWAFGHPRIAGPRARQAGCHRGSAAVADG